MKKTILILISIGAIICFTEYMYIQMVNKSLSTQEEALILPGIKVYTKTITGKVKEVRFADYENERRPKIILISDSGLNYTFSIRSTTAIFNTEWKPSSLDKISKGDLVKVEYKISKEGFKIATSISPL